MSSLETRKIEPQSGTTVTLGEAGDTVAVPAGAVVKTNTVKDSGGNALWSSDGSGNYTNVNSALVGSMTFISSQTASASASIEFTSGLDSTYDEYVFYFVNMQPVTNNVQLSFQGSTDSGSNYNTTMTTTFFRASHDEADTSAAFGYLADQDQHQGTAYQQFGETSPGIGNVSDESMSGELHLFAPSSTIYVKQFYVIDNYYQHNDRTNNSYVAGYLNTTSAINAVSFKMSSGNIGAGTIYLYGIK